MEFMILIVLGMALVLLPVFLFFGLVGLAVLIWSWGRIGRYFINFGRWLSSWRNFIPLTGCGCLGLIVLILLMVLLPQVRILWIILLVVNLIIAFICIIFALIGWVVALCRWGWPRYRRWLWRSVEGAYSFVWTRPPTGIETGPGPRRRPGPPRPPAETPPGKPSILSSFWALMLGKPRPAPARAEVGAEPGPEPKPGPRPVPQPPPKKKRAAKRSWFSSFWALMLGKPSKPPRPKPPPARVQTTEPVSGPSKSAAAATEAETIVTVTETTTVRETGKKEKPVKKGVAETVMGGIGRGMAKAGRKIGEGIEWIRIRLNLD